MCCRNCVNPVRCSTFFYFREQRAKRTCLHVHLATAARVKYPAACCCAFVSLSLGKDKPRDAGRSMGNAILLIVAFSLALCAVYLM
ncbi:hypothetical protein D7V94_16950 [Parablautia intestinalis]|uniref:Uncharacterized protein n=1 Tax=Parablautia intestinalis TaxID=2320100 RepID=A0A3A9AEF9_9FIRM|nr:hypothetical protein D7V94_16950 [Parablautia intestinalis]